MFMGRGPRAGRGEVRTLILDAIADEPRHGYEIIQIIEERTGGYRPSPGAIYPTLQLLEETDLATASHVDERKVYAITDAGRAELEKHRDELEDAHDRLGHDTEWFDPGEFERLWRQVRRVGRRFFRAARRGKVDRATLRAIEAVIDDAAERIQGILDQEPPPPKDDEAG
jgi:DNA-binding PadR family transcriptional regulator